MVGGVYITGCVITGPLIDLQCFQSSELVCDVGTDMRGGQTLSPIVGLVNRPFNEEVAGVTWSS